MKLEPGLGKGSGADVSGKGGDIGSTGPSVGGTGTDTNGVGIGMGASGSGAGAGLRVSILPYAEPSEEFVLTTSKEVPA